MRKPVSLSAAIVLLAAGFAVASIATGGSLAAVAHAWTTLTGTTPTVTTATTGTTGGRGFEICDRFRRGHRFGTRTIVVSFHDHFRLGRGDHLGPCVILRHHRHHGFGFGDGSQNVTTTTTVVTITTVVPSSGFVGKGATGRHGDDGDDDDDDNGGSGSGSGTGSFGGSSGSGGSSWNSFKPSFSHNGGHRH